MTSTRDTTGGERVRAAVSCAGSDPVGRASFKLDCIAIEYGDARLDRDYPKLQRLAKEMKNAAVALARTLREEGL